LITQKKAYEVGGQAEESAMESAMEEERTNNGYAGEPLGTKLPKALAQAQAHQRSTLRMHSPGDY